MFAAKCLLVVMAAVAAHGFSLGPVDIVFHCYTRSNPVVSHPILPTVSSIMSAAFFAPTRDTVIIIHSYNDHVGGNPNAFLVPAILGTKDVNLLAVDWSPGSSMYSNALGNAPQVGQVVADFINILQTNFAYSPRRVTTIIGVGIGGHIAGIAARNVNSVKIPRVIAVDPSLHGWTHHPQILSPTDADVVEVLHATAGATGYDLPLGTIDFYANGGSSQIGCGANVACSHTLAYAFLAESYAREVNGGNAFVGTKCEDYEEAVSQQCAGARDVAFGGTANDKTNYSGLYIFGTNAVQPFAMG